MYSIRKWIFRPKRSDQSLLAGFFYADEELNMVATELDSFDGRKDPERCTSLVNQLRMCQDKVLGYMERVMDDCIPLERASRDFRVKFPDDVLQESLSGQLWFGAECLAAGSSIMNREVESASMRPLAKALTRHLDYLRALLRDQCLRNINTYTEPIKESLILFDRLFAEFEISYVSAMVPVKTMKEYDVMQEVIVLFSETTQRALRLNLLTQDMIDDYDPALMFTIPRLAIVTGLLVYPEGPLNPDMDPVNMSEMFRPFQTLLYKIRELLWTLSKEELWMLEKSLCSAEEQGLYRDLANTFPDHLDPYQDLTELSLDGAMGLGLDSDGGIGRLLAVDNKYGCLSQSPSTMTLVANPDFEPLAGNVPQGEEDEVCRRVHMAKEDGAVSEGLRPVGMVSCEQAGARTRRSESGHSSANGQDSRSLRHSVSWPEATMRTRHHTHYPDVDTSDLGLLEECGGINHGSQQHCRHSHEFNFHLPLNRTDSSNSSADHAWTQRTPTNAVDLGSTRVFYTTDCCNDNEPFPSDTQISYVTETLNEVFVTDTSAFQQSFISAVTSKALTESIGICCKCGNKTCGTHNAQQTVEDQMNLSNTDQTMATGNDGRQDRRDGSDSPRSSRQCHSRTGDQVLYDNGEQGSSSSLASCRTGDQAEDDKEGQGCARQQRTGDQLVCDKASLKSQTSGEQMMCDKEDQGMVSPDKETLLEDEGESTRSQRVRGNVLMCAREEIEPTRSNSARLTVANGHGEGMSVEEDHIMAQLTEQEHCELLCCEVAGCQTATELTDERVAANSTRLVSPSSSDTAETSQVQTPNHSNCSCDSNSARRPTCFNCRLESKSPNVEAEGSARGSSRCELTLRSSLDVPRVQRQRQLEPPTMMCSSCNRSRRSSINSTDVDWDRESYNSSETSSYNSDCHDDEEIALAIQAAELASRREARSRFKSSHDLIHRLFVCISGVADQLQTNYASDLRHILKSVFECNSSETFLSLELQAESSDDSENLTADDNISTERLGPEEELPADETCGQMESETMLQLGRNIESDQPTLEEDPPKWVPDDESPHCEACQALFTFMRRRHHCRNCGKIFCGRCSSNAVPLPQYGHTKPVRVCNHCFMFQVNPFMVDE